MQAFLDPRPIDFDAEKKRAIHRRGQRLCPTHAAESASDDKFSFERSAEMFPAGFREGFKCSLHDSLAADVNPRTGGHLAVHGESQSLQPIELSVVRPVAHEIGIRDQDAGRFIVSPKNADGFAGLDEQCFVVLEFTKRSHDRVERFPTPRRPAGSTVNDQLVRILRHVRIEIVHQHPERGLLMPAFAALLRATRRANHSFRAHIFSVSLSNSPSRIAAATRSISSDSERSSFTAGEMERTRS